MKSNYAIKEQLIQRLEKMDIYVEPARTAQTGTIYVTFSKNCTCEHDTGYECECNTDEYIVRISNHQDAYASAWYTIDPHEGTYKGCIQAIKDMYLIGITEEQIKIRDIKIEEQIKIKWKALADENTKKQHKMKMQLIEIANKFNAKKIENITETILPYILNVKLRYMERSKEIFKKMRHICKEMGITTVDFRGIIDIDDYIAEGSGGIVKIDKRYMLNCKQKIGVF